VHLGIVVGWPFDNLSIFYGCGMSCQWFSLVVIAV
jgi:hypothetical protein